MSSTLIKILSLTTRNFSLKILVKLNIRHEKLTGCQKFFIFLNIYTKVIHFVFPFYHSRVLQSVVYELNY